MFLLARPPWLRWMAAVLVVAAAFAWDLSKRSTGPFPFAARDIASGSALSGDVVEWRDLPIGSLPIPDLDGAMALADIRAGDPITPSVAGRGAPIPEGWWAVPVRLPHHLERGSAVRLVLGDGVAIDAVVTTAANVDDFGGIAIGAVAVPPDVADLIAAASAADSVVVLARP